MSRPRSQPVGELVEVPIVASTMDEARALVLDGRTDLIGVRAGHQTHGRGRQRSRWADQPGHGLLVTYVLYHASALPAYRLAFAGGLAVAEAVERLAGVRCSLKWPNDVLLSDAKVAGVLIETVPLQDDACALVGIGLNVNQPTMPPELVHSTSLRIATGRSFDIEQAERALRERVFHCAQMEWPELLARWRERDATSGRTYRGESEHGPVVGVAEGVEDDGALRLRLADGSTVAVRSATTELQRR